MASTDSTTSGVQRTAVKTRRILLGVYSTLDGSYRTSRNEEGRWMLHDSTDKQVGEPDGYRTSDQALSALVDDLEADLLTLNTPPAKPEPQPTKQELAERFAAEEATRANVDPVTERKRRQRKQPATA
jgi:hypothetical protein